MKLMSVAFSYLSKVRNKNLGSKNPKCSYIYV